MTVAELILQLEEARPGAEVLLDTPAYQEQEDAPPNHSILAVAIDEAGAVFIIGEPPNEEPPQH